jgi:hypothetical protein
MISGPASPVEGERVWRRGGLKRGRQLGTGLEGAPGRDQSPQEGKSWRQVDLASGGLRYQTEPVTTVARIARYTSSPRGHLNHRLGDAGRWLGYTVLIYPRGRGRCGNGLALRETVPKTAAGR